MDFPAVTNNEFFACLGSVFYEAVPREYRTYCTLTSRICQRALQHFGIASKLVPCEVWYASPTNTCAIGFFNTTSTAKWPGHVVCMAETWLIDAAIHHFQKDFNLSVPDIVVEKVFGIASNVITRFDISSEQRLWWVHPPTGAAVHIPDDPEEVIARYGEALAARIRSILANNREGP